MPVSGKLVFQTREKYYFSYLKKKGKKRHQGVSVWVCLVLMLTSAVLYLIIVHLTFSLYQGTILQLSPLELKIKIII